MMDFGAVLAILQTLPLALGCQPAWEHFMFMPLPLKGSTGF